MFNIVLLSSEFPPGPGGIGNHAYYLAMNLHSNPLYNVKVITLSRGSNDYLFDNRISFEIERVNNQNKIFSLFSGIIKIIRTLLNKRYNIIICSGSWALIQISLIKPIFSSVKLINLAHGLDINPEKNYKRFFVNIAMQYSDHIIAVSNYTSSYLKQKFLFKTSIINNGFDPFRLKNRKSKFYRLEGNPKFITVGSISKRKGQENVIRSMKLIKQKYPNCTYNIIGNKTKGYDISKFISENLMTSVKIYNQIRDRDMGELLKQADIFLILSQDDEHGDFEGFGIAVLEANYFGIPAIGSLQSGLSDSIKHNYSGILVNPYLDDDIINAIEIILSNKEKYSINAKEWSKNFFWEKKILEYESIINSLIR